MPEIEPGLLHHELAETYENIRRLDHTALRFETEAAEAQQLAQLLDEELDALRNVLHPIRARHTSGVWHGRAAVESRRRLDRHEDEHRLAIREIDRLIDDLLAHAAVARTSADSSRDALDEARNLASFLEDARRDAIGTAHT